jgi:hypothetical protein
MRREIFSDEHELFRSAFRRFAEAEIAPRVAEWNEAGTTAGSNEIMKVIIARKLGLG